MRAHTGFAISGQADYRSRFARSQREAGLEFKPWAERLKPLRPWSKDLFDLAGMVALVGILWFAFSLVAG